MWILALAACAGPDTPAPAPGTADGAPEAPPAEAPAAAPAGEPAAAPAGEPAAAPAGEPAAAAPTGEPAPAPPADGPDTWTVGRSEAKGATVPATVVAVRAGRHEGFDRVVLELDGPVPGWKAEYVDAPVRRCGSGEAVPVAGDGWLELRVAPSRSHTDAGAPTVAGEQSPGLPNVREIERTCDFEAVTTWVIGVGSPNRYRVFTLDAPPRIVVDVAQ